MKSLGSTLRGGKPGHGAALLSLSRRLLGETFVHPLFDYMVIGGGLSLLVVAPVLLMGWNDSSRLNSSMPALYLLFNSAHFAASTVRLYTKKGSFERLPFLTMSLPLVSLAAVLVGLLRPESIGYYTNKLYLTWSPFHYAATAYGLALMYSYRSGCDVRPRDRKLLRWSSLSPFFYAVVLQERNGVESWLVNPQFFYSHPIIEPLLNGVALIFAVASFSLPLWLAGRAVARQRDAFPLIVPLLMASNGIWWIVFTGYTNAFNLATIFHGLQYLAIVAVFHVKDRLRGSGNTHGAAYHVVRFYSICLALAVALFQFWPYSFVLAGFGKTESILLVIAVINIHHFIVDAAIWKLRSDPNYQNIVLAAAPAAAR